MSKNIINIVCNNTSFEVIKFTGSDLLCEAFEFFATVETPTFSPLVSEVGQAVNIEFIASDGFKRNQAATLFAMTDLGQFSEYRRYQLTLGPRVNILKNQQHSRIIIDTNVQDVINNLMALAGYSEGQVVWRLSAQLPDLAQFVQAQESHFQVFQRLLAQYGLIYWTESGNQTEEIIITDNNLHSPYLARGLLEAISPDGLNREYLASFVGFSGVKVKFNNDFGVASSHVTCYPPSANEQKCEQQFFEPTSDNTGQQSVFSQSQSQANLRNAKEIVLTGNTPDLFAGCSISLDDQTHLFGSGDYLCTHVTHHLTQINNESLHNGSNKYYCTATFIPRGTPFKLTAPQHQPKPMVFSATVESLNEKAQLNNSGEYHSRFAFDKTARPVTSASKALKKLALYACAKQPQATGWHFPLIKGAKVLIGCINNDPNNSYILGFAMDDDQKSVVTSHNQYHNRLLTSAGTELILDDTPRKAKVILQTLGSEHYVELYGPFPGRHFVKWISHYGAINFYSGKDLSIGNVEPENISFVLKQDQLFDVNGNLTVTSQSQAITYQAAGDLSSTADNLNIQAQQEVSLLSGRTFRTSAQSEIQLKTDNANLSMQLPGGSSFIQTDNNIAITGNGSGDIRIHNAGGEIKIDASGNIELIGKDVLTLNGAMTTFDGPVEYKNEGPDTASEPPALSPENITRSPTLDISGEGVAALDLQTITINYINDVQGPMQYASYKITLDDGTVIEGGLNIGGFVEIPNMPVGQYKLVLGEDTREYSDSGIYPTGTMPSNAMIKQNCRGIVSKLANNDTESLKAHYHGAAKAGSWSFGILQQDFNSEVSVENVLIAAIADPGFTTESAIIARDVTAHIMYLAENPNDNNDNDWLKLFLFISAEPIKAFGATLTYVSADRFSAALSALRRLRYGDPVGFISNLVYADFKPATISPRVIAKHLYYACFAILENETMQQKLGPHCIEKINDVYPEKLQNLADILEKGIERGIKVFEKRTTESLALYQEAYPHHGIVGTHATIKAPIKFAPELPPLKGSKAHVKINALSDRLERYAKRIELLDLTKNIPEMTDAYTRLLFNNNSIIRAEAAQYVYRVDEYNRQHIDKLPESPIGLKLIDPKDVPGLENSVFTDTDTGFGASLFKSEISGETMLVFRGTNNGVTGKKDWTTNLKQGVGKETEQYNQAMILAKEVNSSVNGDISIVGHSLGGGLASSGVAVTGVNGFTFNSAGLHPDTAKEMKGLSNDQTAKLIISQHVDGEVLTGAQKHGDKTLTGISGGAGFLAGGPLGAIAGVLAKELLTDDVPQAIGEMRMIPSVNGGNPVARHGMDQVIDGIEEQKSEDIQILNDYKHKYYGN